MTTVTTMHNKYKKDMNTRINWMLLLQWINSNEKDMDDRDWDRRYYVAHTVDSVLDIVGHSGKGEAELLSLHEIKDLETDFQIACGDGNIDKAKDLIDIVDITASNNLAMRWAKHEKRQEIVELLEEELRKRY